MVDLNTLIPPDSGLQLVYAEAVNDAGEIAGIGVPPGVSPADVEDLGHAYVLIPESPVIESQSNVGEWTSQNASAATSWNSKAATAEMMRRFRTLRLRKYREKR